MKKILLITLFTLCSAIYAKDGTHPEFELLDKDGNLVTESGKAFSNARTCGDCHDASEKILVFSEFILKGNLHPRVPLRDSEGKLVIETGEAMSSTNTCGSCHNAKYIQSHSDHANAGLLASDASQKSHPWSYGRGALAGWNFLDYDLIDGDEDGPDLEAWLMRYGNRHVGGGPVVEDVEMNCFICHTNVADLSARSRMLKMGEFEWANSAALAGKELLSYDDDEEAWTWNKEKFNTDGSVVNNLLRIQKPRDENCALCHGLVDNAINKPLVFKDDMANAHVTRATGQIFSPQKINQTGVNISGKADISRPFDVHAARVVGCVNCHYSLNNPVYYQRFDKDQAKHLSFDPRRLSFSEYLQKPLHQFAKGNSLHGLASVTENSLRRCESCHAEESVHDWLPYKQRHFQAMACETCHIPELYGPTLMSVDWGLPDPQGQPVKTYRNSSSDVAASDNLITAFKPILLPRENVGGSQKLAPFNLVTGWFWLAGDPQAPVSREQLVDSFTNDGDYKEEVLTAFDSDQDGQLTDLERRLDSDAKINVLSQLLVENDIIDATITGETEAYTISHNVVNGNWAIRDCQTCHNKESIIDNSMLLAAYHPGGQTPRFEVGLSTGLDNGIQSGEDGTLKFNADANKFGYYVLGLHSVPLVDWLGLLMFLGVSLGVTVHAIARKVASKKRAHTEHNYHKEYIYDSYERLWHWLQASSIIILLITGLIIHKPYMFSIFSFSYMVEVHNIVGFILFANAALALFYNLASGEIRQYIPEPKGFIGRSIAQATYYTKGVFEGQPHPEEKSRDHKMNVLQQITYLAILNLLLPAQVITGILIWGAQEWPEIASKLGGLAFLGPVHTFIAWAFATFIVMHVYLTTHGHTPTAGIKSMISGWDDVEDNPSKSNN